MIPAQIIKKIKRIYIKSSRTVNSIMAGQYKSVFKGSGIEFEEVREYCPGDDVKSIDWKVSARLGRPFVKLYTEVASVLAFNATKNNDKIGVLFFTDQVEKYIPPKKGSSHVWRVIKEIFTFSPKGRKTNISSALDYLAKILKKRSFVFVLSDFMDKKYLKSLRTIRQKHEVIGVMIHDPGEDRLPAKGVIQYRDFETGICLVFDAFDKRTRQHYLKIRQSDRRQTLDIFSKARSDVIELETDASVSDTLTRYFRQREMRIR